MYIWSPRGGGPETPSGLPGIKPISHFSGSGIDFEKTSFDLKIFFLNCFVFVLDYVSGLADGAYNKVIMKRHSLELQKDALKIRGASKPK